MKFSFKYLIVPMSAALAILSTGCADFKTEFTGEDPVTIPASTTANGKVLGGQQPIAGMSLTLYTVGKTGYGSAATALTGGTATTNTYGNFTFGTVTCPTSSALVYMVGTGGYPIAAHDAVPAVQNTNVTLMVGLGACSTALTNFIDMNEVTTVATIYALSPFMTGTTNIGSSSTNATGILNAFATINNLVNTTNGTLPGPMLPTGATIPTAEINTLADMMEQCVNSGGLTGSEPSSPNGTNGSGCDNLFYYATTTSGTPSDTATAMMNIAQHPATQVAGLNSLRSASPVFTPTLDVNFPPSDWTIAISYTGGDLSTPQGIAMDSVGNAWVADSGGSAVSEFSPNGTALSTGAGYTSGSITAPYAIAVDPAGSIWVANTTSVTKLFGASGTALDPTGLTLTGTTGASILNLPTSTAGPISSPKSIAIDALGSVFVTNTGANTVTLINNGGVPIYGSPLSGTGISAPAGVAISSK